ncbi:MAG: hypothetical protein AAB513_02120 [Patescibacteria group bacterium]
MQKIIEKIKIFFTKEKQNIEKPVLFNPYRAWTILFCFIFVMLILFFGLNTYFFFGVKNNTLFTKIEDVKVITRKYNHDTLDKILESFSNRNKNFEEIKNNNFSIIDPSN